jgi:hypothetical protein
VRTHRRLVAGDAVRIDARQLLGQGPGSDPVEIGAGEAGVVLLVERREYL